MHNNSQTPVGKARPKQPQPANPQATAPETRKDALASLERERDLDGLKAEASEHYAASVGKILNGKPNDKRPVKAAGKPKGSVN